MTVGEIGVFKVAGGSQVGKRTVEIGTVAPSDRIHQTGKRKQRPKCWLGIGMAKYSCRRPRSYLSPSECSGGEVVVEFSSNNFKTSNAPYCTRTLCGASQQKLCQQCCPPHHFRFLRPPAVPTVPVGRLVTVHAPCQTLLLPIKERQPIT